MPDDTQSIIDRIDVVMRSEEVAYKANGRQRGGLGTFSVDLHSGHVLVGRDRKIVSQNPVYDRIQSRSADALLKLYSSLPPEGKAQFSTVMTGYLTQDSTYANLSYLIYFVLFRVGERVQPVEKGLRDFTQDLPQRWGRGNLLGMLGILLTFEYDRFNRDELKALMTALDVLRPGTDMQCKDRIIEIQMRILEDDLADVNPEINTDRDQLVNFWRDFFGSETIPNQVNLVEELFREGAFDDARFATCLSRVRVLLIEALKGLAGQLSTANGLPALSSDAEDADVRNWFKQNGVWGDKEKKLVNAVYGLCSDEGSHAAISRREYARVAKNVTYECLVMAIGLIPR